MKYEIHEDLAKVIAKLAKKDRTQYEALLNKIEEIINNPHADHYKNLRAPLHHYKRVHVLSSFVLLFSVKDNCILFRHYDHHDNVYFFRA